MAVIFHWNITWDQSGRANCPFHGKDHIARLKPLCASFPELRPIEQKLFHVFVRMTGQKTQEDMIQVDQTSGVTPHAPA